MKKKIAIIGAGIAGLTFANFLKKNSDFDFMIYEKNEILSLNEGFGIQLAPNSISLLNKIGFNKINPNKIYNPKKLNVYSIKNEKICDLDLAEFNTQDSKYTTLQRSTLIEFLKDDIYSQHIRFGKQIESIAEIKDKILIKFKDNTNDLVDYVVAADGIFSNTRLFFDIKNNKPNFKNAIAIRTILKSNHNLNIDEKNINLILGSNTHLVIYPINGKNELNLVCVVREKRVDLVDTKNLINERVISQNTNLKDLFQGDLKSWPLYSTKSVLPSSNQKVFYLGDAFHGFLPTMAQGASQSIEGAYELFTLLNKNNPNVQSIYFKKRLRRVKIIKRRTDFNFFIFHISNVILKKIRNVILKRLVKSRRFIKGYLGEVYEN
tara:strand:- start:532 stop:1665 length:1134 start_codon:yes stop_codon:yes gene_type:complete